MMSLTRCAKQCAAVLALVAGLLATSAQAQIRDAEIETLLREYTDPILVAADLNPDAVELYVLNDSSINAFVAIGSKIFIHSGLIVESDTPNQLIGVIAHETGHIAGAHLARGAEAISKASTPMLLSLGLGIAAALAGAPELGIGIIGGGQTIAERSFLVYTRTQESEADQDAVTFLDATGQSSQGLIEMFEKFRYNQIVSAFRPKSYVLTHPLASARITALKRRVAASPYQEVKDTPESQHRFDMMKAKLYGFLESPSLTLRVYPPSDTSLPARYARAIAHSGLGDTRSSASVVGSIHNLDQALGEVNELLEEHPDNPYFHELKGQMLFEHGRAREAIDPHARSVELAPEQPLLKVNLARAMIATEDNTLLAPAVAALEDAVRMEPDNAFAWREMAIAHDRLGNDGMANLATAESRYSVGDRPQAFAFAQRALQSLTPGSREYRQALDIKAASQAAFERARQNQNRQQRRRVQDAPQYMFPGHPAGANHADVSPQMLTAPFAGEIAAEEMAR